MIPLASNVEPTTCRRLPIFRRNSQRSQGLPRTSRMLTVRVYDSPAITAETRCLLTKRLAAMFRLSVEEYIRRTTPGLDDPEQYSDGAGI